MGKLTKNGYEYYKTFDCWEPVEAALIVCGIDPWGVNYENIPKEAWDVYANAAVDYNAEHFAENLLLFPEKSITDPDQIEKYRTYPSEFCKEQDRFNTIKLKCFHPPFYISIIKNFRDVDPLLEIVSDPNSRPRYRWANEHQYDEKKPTSEFVIHPVYPFNEGEDSEEILQIYEEMKKLDLWTLDEAILLLGCPLYVHKDWKSYEYDSYENSLDQSFRRYVSRAIDGNILSDMGTDNKKPKQGWRDSYGCRYVNPFEFLEFVKEKDLFSIPPALEWEKMTLESGEFQYQWKSDLNEDGTPKHSEMLSEDQEKKTVDNTPVPERQQDSFEQSRLPTINYQSTDPEKRVDEILEIIMPEVELFYEQYKDVRNSHTHETDQSQDDIKFSIEAFERIKIRLRYLSKEDLQGAFKTVENSAQLTRKKGILAQKIIRRMDPALSGFVNNAQELKKRMNRLKKSIGSQSIVNRKIESQ